MASKQDLLAKLEERFILGQISQQIYDELKAKIQARPEGEDISSDSAAGSNISDSVIKGDVTTMTGAASVGSIIVNVPGDGGKGGQNPEVAYEEFVLMILRAGGRLDGARTELNAQRKKLNLSLRVAQDIEAACIRSMAAAQPAQVQGRPVGPTASSGMAQFFKDLFDTTPTPPPGAVFGGAVMPMPPPRPMGAPFPPPGAMRLPPIPGPAAVSVPPPPPVTTSQKLAGTGVEPPPVPHAGASPELKGKSTAQVISSTDAQEGDVAKGAVIADTVITGQVTQQTGGEGASGASATIKDSVIKGNVTQISGGASVGSVSINTGGSELPAVKPEAEYEQLVMSSIRAGVKPRSARLDFNRHRERLGLSMRSAEEIEAACLRATYKDPTPPPVPPACPPFGPAVMPPPPFIAPPRGMIAPPIVGPGRAAPAGNIITNSLGMRLAFIAPGSFWMGSPPDEDGHHDDELRHRVNLRAGFHLGVTPVTQAQWQAVMGENPSQFKGPDLPVDNINWNAAGEFCRRLSARENRRYRLPTEAQWEYACRAGSEGQYSFTGDLKEFAWYNANANMATHPVGQKQPNAWGLFDMHGNVWEWCEDGYGEYRKDEVTDPTGTDGAPGRVLRGGSWFDAALECRCARRSWNAVGYQAYFFGLRVALV